VVCIDGLEDSSNPPKPATTTKTIEEPSTVPAAPTETLPAIINDAEIELFSTGSEVMDDIRNRECWKLSPIFQNGSTAWHCADLCSEILARLINPILVMSGMSFLPAM
jgi:hypothetical protein